MKTDRSEGLADRVPASRYELSRRLEVIGFGTPPEVFAAHWSDAALTDL
jgi:hypothetical protein